MEVGTQGLGLCRASTGYFNTLTVGWCPIGDGSGENNRQSQMAGFVAYGGLNSLVDEPLPGF